MPEPQFVALDVKFLADLEIGYVPAQGKFDDLNRSFYFLVTSTPLQELADAQLNSNDEMVRDLSKFVLRDYKLWGVLDPALAPAYNGVAEIIASTLISKGIIPDDQIDDGLVIAEAALHGCKRLVTHRTSLRDANFGNLSRILFDHSVVCPIIDFFA